MRRQLILLLPVLLLSGCATAPREPVRSPSAETSAAALTINGTIAVPVYGLFTSAADGVSEEGQVCRADDGYDDIAVGAQVVVSDADGGTLALGTVGTGNFLGGRCRFAFTVADVPTGHDFYGVRVGNPSRGVVQYTSAQIAEGVGLTIG